MKDKRTVYFRDKRVETLFPGEGHLLSPDKRNSDKNVGSNIYEELHRTPDKLLPREKVDVETSTDCGK